MTSVVCFSVSLSMWISVSVCVCVCRPRAFFFSFCLVLFKFFSGSWSYIYSPRKTVETVDSSKSMSIFSPPDSDPGVQIALV